MTEKISVIIPVYKVEKYLDNCIKSIVAQTYRNLEIILVDDGSPDNCPAMCDAWAKKDNRIKVIHKENGGLSDARNVGMAAATGDFIGFVDSDDWISPDMYQLLYDRMKIDGSDIAACDFKSFYDDKELITDTSDDILYRICTAEQAISELIQGIGFRAVAWNKLYRRSILNGEYFEVGRYHEDEFFTYRILDKATCLTYIAKPLYFYRQRKGSIMSSISPKHLDILDAYLERLSLLKKKYPSLYHKDAITFCVSCIGLLQSAYSTLGDDVTAYIQRIKFCRKQLNFTLIDFFSYSFRDQVNILGSAYFLVPFSKLVQIKRRTNG